MTRSLRERAIAEYNDNIAKHEAAMVQREEEERLSRLKRFREALKQVLDIDADPKQLEMAYEDLTFRLSEDWNLQVYIPCPKAGLDDDHCAFHTIQRYEDFISVMAGNSWAWSCEQCDANRLEERRMISISRQPEQSAAERLAHLIQEIAHRGGFCE